MRSRDPRAHVTQLRRTDRLPTRPQPPRAHRLHEDVRRAPLDARRPTRPRLGASRRLPRAKVSLRLPFVRDVDARVERLREMVESGGLPPELEGAKLLVLTDQHHARDRPSQDRARLRPKPRPLGRRTHLRLAPQAATPTRPLRPPLRHPRSVPRPRLLPHLLVPTPELIVLGALSLRRRRLEPVLLGRPRLWTHWHELGTRPGTAP